MSLVDRFFFKDLKINVCIFSVKDNQCQQHLSSELESDFKANKEDLSENLYIWVCLFRGENLEALSCQRTYISIGVCGGEGVSVAQEARLGVFKGNHIYIH